MTETGARQTRDKAEKIDPSRAASAVTRWRKAVAQALGEDPGAALDQPDRRLLMLRIFGSTSRLGELCLSFPAAAAGALIDGPSTVLAEAARDLTGLERGVGGPDALHGALAPLKNRADIAIAIGELGGQWSVSDATAARVDFAERLVDTALRWLVRAAVKRGELTVEDSENFMRGVFALAGGDFAHEDLAPCGPLDIIVAYDEKAFSKNAARGADRVFVRIGAEIREAFEGKSGDYPLFSMRTPLGSGVGGAGFADSAARIRASADGPQAGELRRWLATARVVAGDRTAGGEFLEEAEPIVWNEEPLLTENLRKTFEATSDDPRSVFRNAANLCRYGIGGNRPLFRTASAGDIFKTAANSGVITKDSARRLIAGEELAHVYVSRTQMMKGTATHQLGGDDQKEALAALCNFSDFEALETVLKGVCADAKNSLLRMMHGPQAEVQRYSAEGAPDEDANKLEDLGFLRGENLSAAVDRWAKQASEQGGEKRFSAQAPGLLTDFGETQYPNKAVQLFDNLLVAANANDAIIGIISEPSPRRDALVDAFGCFGAAVAPLVEDHAAASSLIDSAEMDVPQTATEWMARFTPPVVAKGFDLAAYSKWRRETVGRVAYHAASGDIDFDAAGAVLEAINLRTLTDIFEVAQKIDPPKEENGAGEHISLHIFEETGALLPGAPTCLGFISEKSLGAEGDAFARRYLAMIGEIGDGLFAITPDVSHRPGGVAGALVPDIASFKSYVQSEAIAHDQIMLTRGRVIAGDEKVQNIARDGIRSVISGARRADVLFRDLDRARAQKMRRERPHSDWDVDRLEGGRLDVELVISTLIFKHAASHPFVQETDASEALDAMARSNLISDESAQALKSARGFWTRLQVVRALAQWDDPVRSPVRKRLANLISRAAGVQKFDQVRPLMRGYSEDVTRQYALIVLGRPPLTVVAQAAG